MRQNCKRWVGERIEVRLRVERRGRGQPHVPNRRDAEPTVSSLIHSLPRHSHTDAIPEGGGNDDAGRLRVTMVCRGLRAGSTRGPSMFSGNGEIT
jgi:hypothetical protein